MYYYEAAYVVPAITFLGAVSIIFTILCMPNANVTTKLKMFYVLCATFSALPLTISEGLYYISGSAAYYYSSGATYFYFYNVSPVTCKISWFVSLAGEGCAGFVSLQLALERLIAAAFPFRAPMFTLKRSAVGCCLMLLALTAFNGSISSAFGGTDCDVSPAILASVIFCVDYVIPVCLLLICTGALAATLKNMYRQHLRCA